MKRKVLPLLVAAASAGLASAALADDMPTVYGKLNLTLQAIDTEIDTAGTSDVIDDNWQMRNNASRLGVKGSYGINDTLKAVYKVEYEISPDEGDGFSSSDELNSRNIYGGFQGNFGTIIAGKNDSPLKLAQGDVDRFNDLYLADIKEVFVGEERMEDMVMYSSPSFGGFAFHIAAASGEEGDSDVNDDYNEDNDGLTDHMSAAITFQQDMFYAALAMDENVANNDIVRAVAEITLGELKIGAMYQMAEANDEDVGGLGFSGDLEDLVDAADEFVEDAIPGPDNGDFIADEQDGYLVSAEWALNNLVLKAQWGMTNTDWSSEGLGISEEIESEVMSVGADYKLNKNAKLFAYWSDIEHDTNADIVFDGSTFGAGFELKF